MPIWTLDVAAAFAQPSDEAQKADTVISIYKASKYIATSLFPLQRSIFVQSLILT